MKSGEVTIKDIARKLEIAPSTVSRGFYNIFNGRDRIAWAAILSMPYTILTGALQSHKMDVYMGIFNFFIVIP